MARRLSWCQRLSFSDWRLSANRSRAPRLTGWFKTPVNPPKIPSPPNQSHQNSPQHSFHFYHTQFLSDLVTLSPFTLRCTECFTILLFLRSYLCILRCSTVISRIIDGMLVWCLHCCLPPTQIPSSHSLQGDQGDQGPRVCCSPLLPEIVGKKKKKKAWDAWNSMDSVRPNQPNPTRSSLLLHQNVEGKCAGGFSSQMQIVISAWS